MHLTLESILEQEKQNVESKLDKMNPILHWEKVTDLERILENAIFIQGFEMAFTSPDMKKSILFMPMLDKSLGIALRNPKNGFTGVINLYEFVFLTRFNYAEERAKKSLVKALKTFFHRFQVDNENKKDKLDLELHLYGLSGFVDDSLRILIDLINSNQFKEFAHFNFKIKSCFFDRVPENDSATMNEMKNIIRNLAPHERDFVFNEAERQFNIDQRKTFFSLFLKNKNFVINSADGSFFTKLDFYLIQYNQENFFSKKINFLNQKIDLLDAGSDSHYYDTIHEAILINDSYYYDTIHDPVLINDGYIKLKFLDQDSLKTENSSLDLSKYSFLDFNNLVQILSEIKEYEAKNGRLCNKLIYKPMKIETKEEFNKFMEQLNKKYEYEKSDETKCIKKNDTSENFDDCEQKINNTRPGNNITIGNIKQIMNYIKDIFI